MRSNLSHCVEPNLCVAGVCTFFRKATRRRVASAVTGTVVVKRTSPNAASYWRQLVSQPPRRNLQSRILRLQPPSLNPTPHRAVRSARRRCAGSDSDESKAGESSCTVLIARTGIEMTEAPHDNAMHRQFVGHFRAGTNLFLLRVALEFERFATFIRSPNPHRGD